MPGDPAVIKHIDAVRMRKGEGDILLPSVGSSSISSFGRIISGGRGRAFAALRLRACGPPHSDAGRIGAKRVAFSRPVKRANVIFPRHVRYCMLPVRPRCAGAAGVAQW